MCIITYNLSMSFTYFLMIVIDIQTSKWQCKICVRDFKYTLAQITAHLSIIHKITKIFRCYICHFDSNDYEVFEQHFMLKHPCMEMKYKNVHFEKVSFSSCPINISIDNILTCVLC